MNLQIGPKKTQCYPHTTRGQILEAGGFFRGEEPPGMSVGHGTPQGERSWKAPAFAFVLQEKKGKKKSKSLCCLR